MKKNPFQSSALVSIGLPVYNGETYLNDALKSLTAQTHNRLEIIISDNGSTDKTASICKKWLQKDSRIQYFRQKQTHTAPDNFNFTLKKSHGDFFMWASDDDLWHKTFIQKLLVTFLNHKEAALVFPNFRVVNKAGKEQFHLKSFFRGDSRFVDICGFAELSTRSLKANVLYGLFKRNALVSIGGFGQHDSPLFSDLLLISRFMCRHKSFFLNKYLFVKREVRFAEKEARSDTFSLYAKAFGYILRNIFSENLWLLLGATSEYFAVIAQCLKEHRSTNRALRWKVISFSTLDALFIFLPLKPSILRARLTANFRNII